MRTIFFLVLCFATAQAAFAEETNVTFTVDGYTYSNVTFDAMTPATVKIFHKTGVATLPLAKLPPELQKQLGYDPQKAAEFSKLQAEQNARAASERNRRATMLSQSKQQMGDVIQVVPEGLLVHTYYVAPTGRMIENHWWPGPDRKVDSITILVSGHPRSKQFVDQQYVSFYGYQDGIWSYNDTEGAKRTVQRWVYVCEEAPKK